VLVSVISSKSSLTDITKSELVSLVLEVWLARTVELVVTLGTDGAFLLGRINTISLGNMKVRSLLSDFGLGWSISNIIPPSSWGGVGFLAGAFGAEGFGDAEALEGTSPITQMSLFDSVVTERSFLAGFPFITTVSVRST